MTVFRDTFERLLKRFPTCFWCHRRLCIESITRDHFIPLCQGGANHKSNIVGSCASCNDRKGSLLPTKGDLVRLGNLPMLKPKLIPGWLRTCRKVNLDELPEGDTCAIWIGKNGYTHNPVRKVRDA